MSYRIVNNPNTFFVNPYNFVPVNYSKKSTADTNGTKFTGKIQCKIKARTPIAIPDTAEAQIDNIGHKRYPFMKINGKYTIPGSSIRGVIRNVYETVTNSCFSTIDKNSFISNRNTTGNAYKPAFIKKIKTEENGKEIIRYQLYECERYMLNVNPNYNFPTTPYTVSSDRKSIIVDGEIVQSGKPVFFTVAPNHYMKQTRSGTFDCGPVVQTLYVHKPQNISVKQGLLYIGGEFSSKHHESVFFPTQRRIRISTSNDIEDSNIIENALNGLKYTYQEYNADKSKTPSYPLFEEMISQTLIPVWYDSKALQKNILFLSLASIGRIVYQNTTYKLLKNLSKCNLLEKACDACSLFGMISDIDGNSQSGHLRFGDAVCLNENSINKYTTIGELSTPHTSYKEFYSNKGEGYDNTGAEIKGRKFYWHSDDFESINANVAKTKRNSTIQCADKGCEFEFDIYFDNINENQLNRLIWCLTLGENNIDGRYCHKVGHGKPLGLGSAKIIVNNVVVRSLGEKYEISSFDYSGFQTIISNTNDTIKSLLKICDTSLKNNVRYPYIYTNGAKIASTDNKRAAHQWFSNNKYANESGKNDYQPLPRILDHELRMKPYEYVDDRR